MKLRAALLSGRLNFMNDVLKHEKQLDENI